MRRVYEGPSDLPRAPAAAYVLGMSRPRALLGVAIVLALLAMPTVASAADLQVTIATPQPGASVGATVAIVAETVGDAVSVSFDVATGAEPVWTAIGIDDDASDGWTSVWDASGVDGVATVRATATDGSATATATVEVTVDGAPPSLVLELSRSAFSPNRDRRAEWVTVRVTVGEEARLRLEVVAPDGRIRRRLTDEPVAVGTTAMRWNGKSGSGRVVADGRYDVRAVLVDAAGNAAQVTAAVVVDTRAPTVRWEGVRPEPFLGTGHVVLAIRASDRSPEIVARAVVRDATDRLAARFDAVTFPGGSLRFEWNGRDRRRRPTEPGLHTAEVRVRDDAGNTTTTRQPFRNHRPVHAIVTRRSEHAGRRVALTFDDCWSGSAWDRILDVLRTKHAGGSFFCLGSSVQAHPSIARRTVAAGHTIGSHGYDHANVASLSADGIRTRIRADMRVWWDVARATPAPYFRPPFGLYDAGAQTVMGQEGIRYLVLWDVDPWDWTAPGSAAVTQRVVSHARRGSIVVLHVMDGTAAALPGIIDRLRARGLEPVTLEELLHG
jgi:peptidoglycan/xylan/chitin deacetylase (PgdA/CDA1 family)